MTKPIDRHALERALAVRDLTDPDQGPHAMQALLEQIRQRLCGLWGCEHVVHRASPVVHVADNYDRLHYPADGPARNARYTRYVACDRILRTQTSAMIPPLLERLAERPPRDVLLVCPGLVYRRDVIDRLHTGEPHQVDLWRLRDGPLGMPALREMIAAVVEAALPGVEHRCSPSEHPYTLEGLEIEVNAGDHWVEIGECGLALPALLDEAGLDSLRWRGLAMGLGLDRLLMLRKGIDDIRLLRSADPRIASQLRDLSPYRPVSSQPAIRRDLSLAVDEADSAEELGDRVREALDADAYRVEQVAVLSETPRHQLPPRAQERLGLGAGQKNVLVRVVLRDLERSLTHAEGNLLRDRVYAALHRGNRHEWARGHAPEEEPT